MTVGSAVSSFALLAALMTVIPGLDTILVLRAAARHGRGNAFATASGIACGALTWGAAAAVGASALLIAAPAAYATLRLAGAAYMVWMGITLIHAARSLPSRHPDDDISTTAERAWQGWRRGLLTNILNPKVGAFYLAILPQFIPEGTPLLAMGLLLALVHNIEGMLWFALLITGTHRFRIALAHPRTQRCVDGVSGAFLLRSESGWPSSADEHRHPMMADWVMGGGARRYLRAW